MLKSLHVNLSVVTYFVMIAVGECSPANVTLAAIWFRFHFITSCWRDLNCFNVVSRNTIFFVSQCQWLRFLGLQVKEIERDRVVQTLVNRESSHSANLSKIDESESSERRRGRRYCFQVRIFCPSRRSCVTGPADSPDHNQSGRWVRVDSNDRLLTWSPKNWPINQLARLNFGISDWLVVQIRPTAHGPHLWPNSSFE